jgi:hypothetical protein
MGLPGALTGAWGGADWSLGLGAGAGGQGRLRVPLKSAA